MNKGDNDLATFGLLILVLAGIAFFIWGFYESIKTIIELFTDGTFKKIIGIVAAIIIIALAVNTIKN